MSNILSYSDNITGSDWIRRDAYTADDIDKIDDPNGGMSEYPRTAIPSPFAQLDLVYNAFERLAAHKLTGLRSDLRLASDALDVAQLLFDFANHSGRLRIVRWNPSSGLQRMLASGSEDHRLLAETLQLFMTSDAGAYNFDMADDWYILMCDNRVIGSTSPSTFTMGAPGVGTIGDIMVDEGEALFGRVRHLWERDIEFGVYLTQWFNAFPEMRRKLKAVYDYLLVNLETARTRRPELYAAVTERVGNPNALDMEAAAGLRASLETQYSPFTVADVAPRVLGNPLYTRRTADLEEAAGQSDFLLLPSKEMPQGFRMPLVLREGFVNPPGEKFIYVNKPWREDTPVVYPDCPIEERVLPGTSLEYPWITSRDLLDDCLIELATPIDTAHFLDASTAPGRGGKGFLLPVKPLFFNYFPAAMLASEIAPGKPMLELRDNTTHVLAMLRVPVRNGYVELQRVYRRVSSEAAASDGIVMPQVRLSAAIFPFARTGSDDIYNVRLFEMNPGYKATLSFHSDAPSPEAPADPEPTVRSHTKSMRTSYYETDHGFDHIRATLESTDNRTIRSGVILPLWPDYRPSASKFNFAVDFGTTNSHVEYSIDDSPARPLLFDRSEEATLVATLDAAGSLTQSDTLLDIEFLPREISGLYSFPLRTALAENLTNDKLPRILRSVNIPFLYERKSFNGYKVSTKLKWSGDTQLSEQFLRGIMLLIRARVILSQGNPRNTRIVYFYPVSMRRSMQLRYRTLWEQLYMRYISSSTTPDVTALPESVAPAFYYATASRDGSNYVGIDIGGGTTDVVVYRADEEQLHSDLHSISSFRFAGDTLFGDGFAGADADHNPLVQQYASYFSKMVNRESRTSYLDVILSDIMSLKRSEDINAFLFSIENSEALRHLSPLDRRPYSYNALLGDDENRKIIFVYFLTAIIYYVARLMKDHGLEMPKQLCFSGTGSKILNIVGRRDTIRDFARVIIEKVYDSKYPSSAAFDVRMEQDIPKQITCKGGLELQRRIEAGKTSEADYSPRSIASRKCAFTLGADEEPLTYTTVRSLPVRKRIEESVVQFNTFFLQLLDRDWREEFGIPQESADYFAAHANDSLPNYLVAGIEALLPLDEGAEEQVEDVPFFYPLAGIIRDTMLTGLVAPPPIIS